MYPALVAQRDGELLIVISHSHVYLVSAHYAPPALGSRLVTLTSAATVGTTSDTAIRGFQKLQRFMPLRLDDVDEFTARHRHFLFYGPTPDPVLDGLRRSGAVIVLRDEDEDTQLFPMSRPGPYRLYDVTAAPAQP
jgi:hypothetical protein